MKHRPGPSLIAVGNLEDDGGNLFGGQRRLHDPVIQPIVKTACPETHGNLITPPPISKGPLVSAKWVGVISEPNMGHEPAGDGECLRYKPNPNHQATNRGGVWSM